MNDLRSAAKFVEFSQNHEGEGFQSHFSIKDNFMKGSNGILTIGCRCDVNFAAFPESLKLIAVLSKCGKDFSVKLKDKKRLEIKTDKILAFVPCLPSEEHLLQIDHPLQSGTYVRFFSLKQPNHPNQPHPFRPQLSQ